MKKRTSNVKKNAEKGFHLAFGRIPGGDQMKMQHLIRSILGWSQQVFSYKKNGNRNCNPMEREKIEYLFRLSGLNAWTGDKIQN